MCYQCGHAAYLLVPRKRADSNSSCRVSFSRCCRRITGNGYSRLARQQGPSAFLCCCNGEYVTVIQDKGGQLRVAISTVCMLRHGPWRGTDLGFCRNCEWSHRPAFIEDSVAANGRFGYQRFPDGRCSEWTEIARCGLNVGSLSRLTWPSVIKFQASKFEPDPGNFHTRCKIDIERR